MIRIASKQASRASADLRHKLGAVIVKSGRVLSTGCNEIRYSRELKNPTVHAEEAAILKLLKAKRLSDLAGADIYVSRVTTSGNCRLARPCSRCMGLIKSVGLSKVIYTNDVGGTETLSL